MIDQTNPPAKRRVRGPGHPIDAKGFTTREKELLLLLSKGFRVPEAAEYIGISRHTMADHLKKVLKKTDACTQAEAVYRAVKEGVIQ